MDADSGPRQGVALGALTRPRELGVCAVAGSGSGGRLGASVLRVHKTEADSWDTTRMSDSERGYRTVLGLGWSGDGQASIDVAVEALVLDQSSESYFPGDPNFSRESNDKDPVWSARSLLRLPMLAGEGRAHLSWVSHDGSRTTRNRAGESRLRIEDDGFSGIADLAWVRELTGPGQAIVGVSLETHDDERRYLEPESLALFESRGRRLSWFAGVERSPRSWLTLRGGASQSHAWSWTRFRSHIRAERTAQSALSDPAPTLGVGFRSGALQIDLELQPERAFEDVLASLSIVARL
ncbi:MAG: hypothetical protein IPK72_09280 [Candidatus Eisenbacteria bacterium]|nr:hypothetical protein [Candidatus Eisenbacteria bacterium]